MRDRWIHLDKIQNGRVAIFPSRELQYSCLQHSHGLLEGHHLILNGEDVHGNRLDIRSLGADLVL